ncbi:hypothetical protein NQ315_005545 [Exocentrus adspersus]|uniref:SH3 domain-binding glutamic acid-rich protein n=1 Tax=Exocentrus adspersus TaxID=1586481 RepID=A0AAV8VUE7_9CUCU|nr:hypothetical protein NQ315_005545 [Exocentrus adspersus]
MVIKIYISGISGNKEVKKRQQRVLLILDSKNIKYEVIDIAEPGAEEAKDFMQNTCTSMGATISDPNPRHPLPPQLFNDDVYCGDYDQFDMANEIDEMEKFLKLEVADSDQNLTSNAEIKLKNGEVTPEENKPTEEESKENEVPNEQEKTVSEEKSNDVEADGNEGTKDSEDTSEEKVESKETEDSKNEESKESEDTKDSEAAGDKEDDDDEESKDEKADEA